MLAPEGINREQRLAHGSPRRPSRVLCQLGIVAHVNKLVAGTPSLMRITQALACHRRNLIDQLDKRNCVLRSAANVVDLAGCLVQAEARSVERAHKIPDIKHVAHLASIAVDHERSATQSRVKNARPSPDL